MDVDGIALITIDQPGRSINVVTPDLVAELFAAIEQVVADTAINGAVLCSAKPGCFLAGADLKEFVTAYERGVTAAQARDFSRGFQRLMRRMETCGKLFAALLGRITPTTNYALLDGCDLVVEAVFESREVKREVTQRAEATLPVTTIFASNTSTLPIHSLATASLRPAQFIGLHFFSPVDRMSLVEVIMSSQTSQETLARALDFTAQMKKTPIVVNDGPGFYTTRVFSTYIDEGACMLAEGVAPALIENAARLAGMPVGPLAQFDEVSQELSWKIVQQARADALAEQYTRSDAAPVIEKMLQLQRRGRRYGAGFYEYPQDGGKKFLWPGLSEHFPVQSEQPGVEEPKTRFLTIQALEAARCVEEGVVTDAADADLGSVLGIVRARAV